MAKQVKEINIDDLIQDDHNANRGTILGQALIEASIENLGLGRSIVVDRNNKIIAGNKTQKGARAKGITNALVVETDGSQLVVVKRTDLDMDDPKGRALALADNRTAEQNLNWDNNSLEMHFEAARELGMNGLVFELHHQVSDEDIDGLFTDREKAGDNDDESKPGGYGQGGNALEFSIILNYSPSDFAKVKAAFGNLEGSPEEIVLDLLGITSET